MNSAIGMMNLKAVSAIFNHWISYNNFEPSTDAENKKASSMKLKKSELERNVQPAKARSVPEKVVNKEPRKYTRADIDKLNQRLLRGEFKGREDDFEKEQAKMMEALAEGNIIN